MYNEIITENEKNKKEGVCSLKLQYKDGSLTEIGKALNEFPVEVGNGWSENYKAEQIVLSLTRLYQNQKEKLQGLFTLGEANLIISAFNGFMYTPWNDDKEVVLRMIEGVMTFEYSSDDIYAVSKDKLFRKLHKLDSFSCFTVIRMAFEYWERRKPVFGEDKLLKEVFGIK